MYTTTAIRGPENGPRDPYTYFPSQSKGQSVNVSILDTTLRDGAQALPDINQFKPGSKVDVAHAIATLGVSVIEVGMAATEGDTEEIREIARTVGRQKFEVGKWSNNKVYTSSRFDWRIPTISVLTRALPQDIEIACDSVNAAFSPRVHVFIPTDKDHIAAKFGDNDSQKVLRMINDGVVRARNMVAGNRFGCVEFSPEIATTTNSKVLEQAVKTAVAAGAMVINVPDTVGQRDPFWMRNFYYHVIDWVMSENKDAAISAHNHNDNGMAVANTFALVSAASEYSNTFNVPVRVQLETTVCGLGERAGNADIFPVAAGLWKFASEQPSQTSWQFNPQNSVRVARQVMESAGMVVPAKSPIVGSDTFVHRSGIHSDGVIKGGHRLYTPHDPTFWGHATNAVHEDGKYQGKRGRQAAMGVHQEE